MDSLAYGHLLLLAVSLSPLVQCVISDSSSLFPDSSTSPFLNIPHASNSSDSPIFLDMATQSITLNSSGGNDLQVQCNAQKFGSPLSLRSCHSVIANIAGYDKEGTFGMRYSPGAQFFNCGLPYRWLSVDGLCQVQLFLIAPAVVAHASADHILAAANAIYNICGAKNPSRGGVATNIGGDNKLAVVLGATNYPNVRCRGGQAPTRLASDKIISNMKVFTDKIVFGPGQIPPNVRAPYIIASDDNTCWVVITTSEGSTISDRASWYDIWEQVSAIDNMCLSQVLNGRATRIGDARKIQVEMAYHHEENPATA